MEFDEVIKKRKSVRQFLNTTVEQEKIEKLIEYANLAPSACNRRPCEFYVIENKEIIEQIKVASRFSNHNYPLLILVAGNRNKFLKGRMENYYTEDCSAAIENILLGAVNLGLGALWMGVWPIDIVIENIKNILNLDDSIVPFGLVGVGYEDGNIKQVEKTEQKVHYIK